MIISSTNVSYHVFVLKLISDAVVYHFIEFISDILNYFMLSVPFLTNLSSKVQRSVSVRSVLGVSEISVSLL